jgi:hypothetical protein
MKPPHDAIVIQTKNSDYWFDNDGILCVITKDTEELPLELQREQIENFVAQLEGRHLLMLVDMNGARPRTKASRVYMTEALPRFVRAVAFIGRSPMQRVLANLFVGIKTPEFPTRFFSDEYHAREWLLSLRPAE